MTGVVALASALALGAGCGGDSEREEEPDDPSIVQLDDAQFEGSVGTSSRQFLGIPYAKPPVGALRWKAPEKPDPWPDLQTAKQFGKRCAQNASPTLMNAESAEEDCLYLNVWTPFPVPQAPLPVMVWIHGGGNTTGSASDPVPFVNAGLFYSGQDLAENHGVVLVSLNYRLGIFGFFAHPALTAEGSSGNQGLLDQKLALEWVRDNIAKFGGDPGNVTIFGESAGAFDVCMHVASPQSRGLFHRAISQSGGCTTRQRTKVEAELAATTLATRLGCAGTDALACLRGKSVGELRASSEGFGLHVDGQFMPDQPRTLYDSGQIAKVPYLLGSNTDEGTLFLGGQVIVNEEGYRAALMAMFPDTWELVAEAYAMERFAGALPNPAMAALARVIGDSRLVCSTYDTAVRASASVAVHMYNFDIPVPSAALPPGVFLGATHGAEITSVFGTSPLFAVDTQAKAASDLMQRYWTNFAKTGDPNGGADLKWPALTASENVRINFALPASTIVNDFRAAECDLWRAGYNTQFPR